VESFYLVLFIFGIDQIPINSDGEEDEVSEVIIFRKRRIVKRAKCRFQQISSENSNNKKR